MIARIRTAVVLVPATAAAAVLVAVFVLALFGVGADPAIAPTDAPSGERAEPCPEDDRACNEWIDVREGAR